MDYMTLCANMITDEKHDGNLELIARLTESAIKYLVDGNNLSEDEARMLFRGTRRYDNQFGGTVLVKGDNITLVDIGWDSEIQQREHESHCGIFKHVMVVAVDYNIDDVIMFEQGVPTQFTLKGSNYVYQHNGHDKLFTISKRTGEIKQIAMDYPLNRELY